MDLLARQRLLLETEQMLSRAVSEQYASFAVEREDSQGTRLDHHLQLPFRVDAQPHLLLALAQMLYDGPSLLIQLRDKIACEPEAGGADADAYAGTRSSVQRAEPLTQEPTRC